MKIHVSTKHCGVRLKKSEYSKMYTVWISQNAIKRQIIQLNRSVRLWQRFTADMLVCNFSSNSTIVQW